MLQEFRSADAGHACTLFHYEDDGIRLRGSDVQYSYQLHASAGAGCVDDDAIPCVRLRNTGVAKGEPGSLDDPHMYGWTGLTLMCRNPRVALPAGASLPFRRKSESSKGSTGSVMVNRPWA